VLAVLCCLQIPGFYFDPDKKRYFRIVSGHDNVMAGAVTAEVVAAKNECKHSLVLTVLDTVKKQRVDTSHSFVSIFQNMQIGQAAVCNVRSRILTDIVQNLAWHNTVSAVPVVDFEDLYSITDSFMKQMFCTTDENQLICLWSLQTNLPSLNDSALQRFEITDTAKSSSDCTTLQYVTVGSQHNTMPFKGIMSACVAPTDMLPDCHVEPVLYAAALESQPLRCDAIVILDPLDSTSPDESRSADTVCSFYVGTKWVWSCAWSSGLDNKFAVGTEKLAFLFDANTGKRFALDTRSSDVLSLAFTSLVSAVSLLLQQLNLTQDLCLADNILIVE